jgi:hypothetical protein
MNILDATAEQRQHFETIFKRAASDTKFRRRLLDQPKKAIQESTGVRLPDTYSIQFIETPKGVDALIPLPELIDEDVSLTVDELEAVAGGAVEEWCCGQCSDCSICSQCSALTTQT